MIRRAVLALLGIMMLPSMLLAGPTIPGFYGTIPTLRTVAPTQLPVLKPGGTVSGLSGSNPVSYTTNQLTINQIQSKAIIDWSSFDIGANASVYFNQQGNTSWVALNRIWDNSPSQIFGQLRADGQVYLINQNGILFGPGAQVNVHGLVASSLYIQDNDFLNGIMHFTAQDYNSRGDNLFYGAGSGNSATPGAVSNAGVIQTDALGSVFLIGPTVENSGVVTSFAGQIGLIAATEVQILQDPMASLRGTAKQVYLVAGPGTATNFENGWLIADTGLVGMYGQVVNQEGLIRSITAVQKPGYIELLASNLVSTGPNSLTSSRPSDSTETVEQSSVFQGGTVDVGGFNQPNYDLQGNLTGFQATAAPLIEHRGIIEAPSGTVNFRASQRAYFETGSKVDVSGVWVDETADANLAEQQLNSVELRDDYGQKSGLLKGLAVQFNALYGSAIGDVSGSLTTQNVTASQKATQGGTVTIDAGNGDVILKDGAQILFAGGGVHHGAGQLDTTTLLSGTKVYSISSAPEWVQYDQVMDLQTVQYQRYGITKEFRGLFTGGANPVGQYSAAYTEGADAGSLRIAARTVVLDGVLDGSVVQGPYQTQSTENQSISGTQDSSGLAAPRGGALVLGVAPNGKNTQDLRLEQVIIEPSVTPLPLAFGPTDPIPAGYGTGTSAPSATILSAQKLNDAALGRLEIYANNTLTIEKGANISVASRRFLSDLEKTNAALVPLAGGYFVAAVGRIENSGTISVAGGEIDLSLVDNISSSSIQQRIYLAPGSVISAAGEQIDNSKVALGGTLRTGLTTGGTIALLDATASGDGVIVSAGALVDVSGGWTIDPKGKITGGDAGKLQIGGHAVVIDGTLKGLSLPGNNGGSLTLSPSSDVTIASTPLRLPEGFSGETPLPAAFNNQTVFGAAQFSDTGFANITIQSSGSLTLEGGVQFSPSLAKTALPDTGPFAGSGTGIVNNIAGIGVRDPSDSGLIRVLPETISSSSITLTAGKGLSQDGAAGIGLNIQGGSQISVFPGGSVQLEGPGVDLAGTVYTPAGKITVTADYFDLTVRNGGRILAAGYNKAQQSSVMKGFPVGYTTMDGGAVNLKASNGSITLEPGSLVDVSGSDPVKTFMNTRSGLPEELTVAANPGSLTLTYGGSLSLGGEFVGLPKMGGLPGGALSIVSTGLLPLAVTPDSIASYQRAGFDDLTFQSNTALEFPLSFSAIVARRLTLDAPLIEGTGNNQVALTSPWIRLFNSYYPASTTDASAAASGQAQLSLSGDWIDVQGSVTLSGFSRVALQVKNDMTLSDKFYGSQNGGPNLWKGSLETAGDLVLQAGRIYPTTLSQFTVRAGTVTILPGDGANGGPIYSAGGLLAILANDIEDYGVLAAPLGQIVLAGGYDSNAKSYTPANRVYLAPGSIVTTAGESLINYGTTDGTFWTIPDRSSGNSTPTVNVTAPVGSVTVKGNDVSVSAGSEIDVSGGGTIFSHLFLSSPSGSVDPLAKTGVYVILPDRGVVQAGPTVYLQGGAGLSPGYYSLLPEDYAFVPGAMILTNLSQAGQSYTLGQTITAQGYQLVQGYSTTTGTNLRSPTPKGYSIQKAEDVLNQGSFIVPEVTAGGAGKITIAGNSASVDGTLRMKALPGYAGGTLGLSANTIVVGQGQAQAGVLTINPRIFGGMDLQEIDIGDLSMTNSITVEGGSILQASRVTLAANAGSSPEITLKSGSEIHALSTDGQGVASFLAPAGTLTLESGATVYASDGVSLQTANSVLDPGAILRADHSSLNLQGSTVAIYDPANSTAFGQFSQSNSGTVLTESQWNNLAAIFENITLTSSSDVVFGGSLNLSTKDLLTIDAGRIMDSVANSSVSLSAQTIALQNTTGATGGSTLAATGGQIAFNASQIQVNHGNILFDGFSGVNGVNLNAQNNVTFRGVGSLTTGGGNLAIRTPRVATSYYVDAAGVYTAANYAINAGTGMVTMAGTGSTSASTAAPGGTFSITAGGIDISTIVEVPSGQIVMTATGTPIVATPAAGNITLESGGQLLARGYYTAADGTTVQTYAPGGIVSLASTGGGAINIAGASGNLPAALMDVSAGFQGDGGSINLYAPVSGVTLNGTILGLAQGGKGGSFALVTNSINGFSALNSKLASGGFNETLDLEARSGDITIAATDYVRARSVTITADGINPDGTSNGGSIGLSGKIDVSQPGQGGEVGLYAKNSLTVDSAGYIDARGTATDTNSNASGGNVTLSVDTGRLTFSGGTIDVSGSGQGAGGTVLFRNPPPPSGGPSTSMSLAGKIKGARSVIAEVDQVYQYSVIDSTAIGQITTDIDNYMAANAASLKTQLVSGLTDGSGNPLDGTEFHFQAGVVIQSAGDITLSQEGWDLTDWRPGNEPGTLTLRAAGNLNINANLVDHPTALAQLGGAATPGSSWALNLVAGSDLGNANPMAVRKGSGNLTIGPADPNNANAAGVVVYSEGAPVRIASGGDALLLPGPAAGYMTDSSMLYTLGSFSGNVRGDVKGTLTLQGGAIQTATGNIDIDVGQDLVLSNASVYGSPGSVVLGSIRTTGKDPQAAGSNKYWEFSDGGDISLEIGGSVKGQANTGQDATSNAWGRGYVSTGRVNNVWAASYQWSPRSYQTTAGIATMAGGDIRLQAGGDVFAQIGTFGGVGQGITTPFGDLSVYGEGNVDGRFLVTNGTANINAMANIGTTHIQNQAVEMFYGHVNLSAQGSIAMGSIVNPMIAASVGKAPLFSTWNLQYATDSSVTMTAVTGDVSLSGQSAFHVLSTTFQDRVWVLPPILDIYAGRDILLSNNFSLAPSSKGNLILQAGRDINGAFGGVNRSLIVVSDLDPSGVYGTQKSFDETFLFNVNEYATTPVHLGDATPVQVSAGRDILELQLSLPKMARISAVRDIRDLYYSGQNIDPGDVTSITAGRDLFFSPAPAGANNNTGVVLGGPGTLVVEAGNNIDLGASAGIRTVGSGLNPALGPKGSDLILVAGADPEIAQGGMKPFFDELRNAGDEYSALLNGGDAAGAEAIAEKARKDIIVPLMGATGGEGNVNMTQTQVSTTWGKDDIYVLARGTINVGKSTFETEAQRQNTGIFTAAGGAINMLVGGDLNVNESRVMTFLGGDITIYALWGTDSAVNAGRGSKTAVTVQPPKFVYTYQNKTVNGNPVKEITGVTEVFTPPAVGSGIRTLTYDASGEGLGGAPPEGDVSIFAKTIDAGEAGIHGRNVTLGATTVLNAANITFSAGSAGVPTQSTSVSLGALSGTSDFSKNTISSDTGALATSQERVASAQPIEDMVVKWIDVKVMSYDLTFGGDDASEDKDDTRKKK